MLRLSSRVRQLSRPAADGMYATRKCPTCWALLSSLRQNSSQAAAPESKGVAVHEYKPIKKLLVANRGKMAPHYYGFFALV